MASGAIEVRVVGTTDFKQWQRAQREFDRMAKAADTLENRIRRAGESMTKVGRTFKNVGSSMSRFITAPVVAIGAASIKSAADFETSLSKIEGLVGVASHEMGQLRDAARQLGPAYGVSANEAAEALFFITSAGLRGATAIETLESALKASAVGLGDTATIADLSTSVLNAYGEETLSAAEATDNLTNAVRLGKLEPTELAGAVGQVIPLASAMGVSFDQVSAAFAAMSRTGTNAAIAGTQLSQIFSQLLSVTPDSAKALESVGLSAEGLRRQLREEGLLSVLQTLVTAFDGNAAATEAVFGNIRALRGVVDLMGSNVEATTQIFDDMTRSVGVTNEAFGVTADTANFKFRQSIENLRGAMLDLGTDLLPVATDIAESISGIVDAFQQMSDEQQKTIIKAIGLTAVLGPLLIILGQLVTIVGGLATLYGIIGGVAFAAGIAAVGIAALVAYAALKPYNAEIAAQNRLKRDQILLDYEGTDAHMLRSKALLIERRERTASADASRYAGQAAYYEAGGFDYLAAARVDATKAAEDQTDATDDQTDAMDAAVGAVGDLGPAMISLTEEMRTALQTINDLYVGTSEAGDELAQYARDVLAAGFATEETQKEIEALARTLRQQLSSALSDAEGQLRDAQRTFEQYRDSIADGIRSGNTISDAASAQTKATEALAEAERAYADAQESDDPDRIAEAAQNLADARDAQGTFTDFLARGAETAQAFSGQIDALRLAGASLAVTQEIAQLGAETGGRIVAELLAGGAEAIQRANELTAVVEAASIAAGAAAAEQFYGAGVRAAQAMVDGLRSQIDELDDVLEAIVERIADAFERQKAPTADVAAGQQTGRRNPVFVPDPTAPLPDLPLGLRWGEGGLPAIAMFADGGLVTNPMLGIVGEAGPELIVPLDRVGQMGGKTIVNVTVTSADPQAVIEAIRRYTRSNGPLGATVTL